MSSPNLLCKNTGGLSSLNVNKADDVCFNLALPPQLTQANSWF